MKIGTVDLTRRVLVVAEIGNNHEGRLDVALRLVREAARCGVDAVKFQTFRTEHFVLPSDAERFRRLKSFELPPDAFGQLAQAARNEGLLFLSTPLDLESVAVLEELVDAYKVASGDNTFFPLIDRIVETGKPIIVSTGLSTLEGVLGTVAFVRGGWVRRGITGSLAVLHCVSSYPTPPGEANLRAIRELEGRLGVPVGWSDHMLGIEASVLAVAAGARIVEKHFTLDRNFSTFRDHQLSADPPDLAALVTRIRAAEELLGDGAKRVQASEAAGVEALRRSIVAAADLPAGHSLRLEDLTWTRPGGGLPPGREDRLLGRPLRRDLRAGEALSPGDVR